VFFSKKKEVFNFDVSSPFSCGTLGFSQSTLQPIIHIRRVRVMTRSKGGHPARVGGNWEQWRS